MTKEQKEEVKKAHLLLTFFNAMQPGVFMVSGWDLVGAYPLKPEQVKELIKDGDNRWINRGAYDLLGNNPNKKFSPSKLPRAQTLYGSLKEQLRDPHSYVSILKRWLKARKDYKINLAWPVDILKVDNSSLYIATYKLHNKSFLIVAMNFSKKPATQTIELSQIKHTKAKDIITGKREDKKYFSEIYNLKLDAFGTKAIIFD